MLGKCAQKEAVILVPPRRQKNPRIWLRLCRAVASVLWFENRGNRKAQSREKL